MAAITGGAWEFTNSTTISYVITGTNGKKATLVKLSGLENIKASEDNIENVVGGGKKVLVGSNVLSTSDIAIEHDSETDVNTVKVFSTIFSQAKLVLSPSNGYNAVLAFGDTQSKEVAIVNNTENLTYDGTKGTATITADLSAGYTLSADKKSATYSSAAFGATLATISGLAKGANERTISLAKFSAKQSNENAGTITLSKAADVEGLANDSNAVSVLGTSAITLTVQNVAKNNGIDYNLKLGEKTEGAYLQSNNETKNYWKKTNATTAVYQYDSATGYAYNQVKEKYTDATDNTQKERLVDNYKKIDVTAAKTTVIATVSGLNADTVVDETKEIVHKDSNDSTRDAIGTLNGNDFTKGLEASVGTRASNATTDPVTVTFNDRKVLPVSGTVKITAGKGYTATTTELATGKTGNATEIPTKEQEETIWVINGNTAVLKRVNLVYYTSGNNQIATTAQKDIETLVTVKGLNPDQLLAATKTTSNYNPAVITKIAGINYTKATVASTAANGKITYNNNGKIEITDEKLLNEANVTVTANYKLKIAEDLAPHFTNQQWDLNGTTAILRGEIKGGNYNVNGKTELNGGYTVSDDGRTITYTAKGVNQTLATITGLKKGTRLVVDSTTKARTIGFGSTAIDPETRKDYFKSGVTHSTSNLSYYSSGDNEGKLDKLDITISNNVLDTAKVAIKSTFYQLALDEGTVNGGAVPTEATVGQIGWHGALASTITLKKADSAYYTIDAAGTVIAYNKPTNVTNLATIKGLNKNITEDDIEVKDDKITLLNANAVSGATVTITNAQKVDKQPTQYKLALPTGSVDGLTAPELSNNTWTQNGNTVTFAADVKAGYTLKEDGSAINYSADSTNTTLATITGLALNLARVTETDSSSSGNDNVIEPSAADDDTETVDTSKQFKGVVFDQAKGTITISASALNGANVALKGAGNYTLKLNTAQDSPDKVRTEAVADKDTWVISGSTATLKRVNTDFYTLNEANNTITYNKAADVKYTEGANKNKVISFATIKGLATDKTLVVKGDTEIGYYDASGNYVEAIKIDTSKKAFNILDKGVLDYKSNISLDVKSATDATYKDYHIAIDSSIMEDVAPSLTGSATWESNNKGTAYYVDSIGAGYSQTDNLTLTYYASKKTTLATASGLPNSITTDILNDTDNGFTVNNGVINISNDSLLGSSNVTLNTNVQFYNSADSLLSNYQFSLGSDVTESNDVTSKPNWILSGTNATYGAYTPTYYELGDNDDDSSTSLNNVIYYHGEGVSANNAAVSISGLASGLEVKSDGSIKGISMPTSGGVISLAASVIDLGKNVSLADTNGDSINYKLILAGTDIPTPRDTIGYNISNDSVSISNEKTAGYSLSSDNMVLEYIPATEENDASIVRFSGLNNNLKKNSDGGIDGIEITADKKIILSNSVLDKKTISYTIGNNSGYSVSLSNDVPQFSQNGVMWEKTSAGFVLKNGAQTSGYSTPNGGAITYTAAPSAADNGVAKVTLTGLNATVSDGKIAGIFVNDNTIVLSNSVLSNKNVSLTGETGWTLSLESATADSVAAPSTSAVWSFDTLKGIATHTETITAGYELENDSRSIKYTPNSSIISTITNLNKEDLKVATDGSSIEGGALSFDNGVFSFTSDSLFAHKDVKLSVKASNNGLDISNYQISLGAGVAASVANPIWNKTNTDTKATLTQQTASGYTLDNEKTIKYNSDPVIKTVATVTGLKKEVAADANGLITGLTIGSLNGSGSLIANQNGNVIEISNDVLNNTDVKLGNGDAYTFVLDAEGDDSVPAGTTTDSVTVGDDASVWAVSGSTATFKAINKAYYKLTNNDKTLSYNKEKDVANGTVVAIKGLKSGLKASADGQTLEDADGNEVVAISGTQISLTAGALGNSKVEFSNNPNNYSFTLDADVADEEDEWKELTEWAVSGTTATYKTYNKAHYALSEGDSIVNFTNESVKATYAQVSGIKNSAVLGSNFYEAKATGDESINGGTIFITDGLLGDSKISLTIKNGGDFKLSVDSLSSANISSIGNDAKWSTKNTTATYSGTLTKGYRITEDAKTINYYKADTANQTIAQVSGIKSGAQIADSNVAADDGYQVISLGSDQLNKTKVTVKGDYYKLALGNDTLKSDTDEAVWIKANNSTNATYTQKTYDGYNVADAGKTINYLNKSANINLISLGGLNKTITAADFGTTNDVGNSDKLVILDTVKGEITVKKGALTNSNLTLGKNDDYTLLLDSVGTAIDPDFGTHWNYSNGTAKLVSGKSEGWVLTNPKTITYTKESVESTFAEVSGLPKNLIYDSAAGSIGGIEFDTTSSVITLDEAALTGTNKITLTNKGDSSYTFTLAADSLAPNAIETNRWNISGTNATLKTYGSAGYSLGGADNIDSIITAVKESTPPTALATIGGLPKGLTVNGDSLGVVDKDKNFTAYFTVDSLSSKVSPTQALIDSANTAKIAVTLSNYEFNDNETVITDSGNDNINIEIDQKDISKGTAVISKSLNSEWSISGADSTDSLLTYTPAAVTTYATVTGLLKGDSINAANLSLSSIAGGDDSVITVDKDALTTSNVNLKLARDVTASLALGNNVYSSVNSNESAWKNQTEWALSGGTATYRTYDKANYYQKNDATGTIIYVAPKNLYTYATVSGLNKTASLEAGASMHDTNSGANNGKITLSNSQLNKTKVTLKISRVNTLSAAAESLNSGINNTIASGNETAAKFKLDLANSGSDSVSEVKDTNLHWDTDTNGTTAILKGDRSAGYLLSTDKMTVTYQAEAVTGTEIARVSGIAKNTKIEDNDVSTDTADARIKNIKLRSDQLTTSNVVLKGEGYKLTVDSAVVEASETAEWKDQTEWVTSGTTATYKLYDKAYYEVLAAGNQITYHKAADIKANGHLTYAVLSGIAKDVSLTIGNFASDSNASNKAGNAVITVNSALMGTSTKVALTDTNGDGFTLELGNDLKNSLSTVDTLASTQNISTTTDRNNVTTFKFTGKQGTGYTISNDGLTITRATAVKNNQTIAQITGVKSEAAFSVGENGNYDYATNVFTIDKSSISAAVTVSGTAKFNFSDYTQGSLVGSTGSDNISLGGGTNSISAGKGNDYVDLESKGSNVFFYANGDGNDIIKGFSATDKIKLTNIDAAKVSIVADYNDAVVKIDKATIRLKGFGTNYADVEVIDKDGDTITSSGVTSASSENIFEDDNYELTPQLSSIVKSSASYTVDDDSSLAQDATSLAKQAPIAYSDKK